MPLAWRKSGDLKRSSKARMVITAQQLEPLIFNSPVLQRNICRIFNLNLLGIYIGDRKPLARKDDQYEREHQLTIVQLLLPPVLVILVMLSSIITVRRYGSPDKIKPHAATTVNVWQHP
jgi:hypothetical protein